MVTDSVEEIAHNLLHYCSDNYNKAHGDALINANQDIGFIFQLLGAN